PQPPALALPRLHPAAVTAGALAFLTLAVAAFTRMWAEGGLVLDGPGVSLFVRLSLDHWQGLGVPYWWSDMWSGSPVWSLAPSFPVLMLVPLAAVVGPDEAVKLASVAAQVVGAWGAFVLVRSLWQRLPAAVVAGVVYGLHPLFASHALFGHETSLWVMAATPWLVWSLRLALRGDGALYVALAGLLIGFAILQQAEHVYALAILCAALLAVEVARARFTRGGPRSVGGVLFRAVVVVALGLGVIAHWLLPFVTSHEHFVLTTPDSVRAVLVEGIAGDLGREMGLFVNRAEAVNGSVGFERDLLAGNFYLSWVALALTLLTLPFLGRHDRDGCLTAVLFASAVGVWMSTAAVPLAVSGPAERRQLLPFIVVGGLAGLLVGSFISRLRLGRAAAVGGVLTTGLLVGLPYFAPFLALQRVIPFLESIRFPRFYHVAALGMAMGSAYAVVLVQRWAEGRDRRAAPVLAAAAGLVVLGAFVIDAHPYRSYYRTQPPGRDAAYADLEARLAALAATDRLGLGGYGDPGAVDRLLQTGRELATGWPHPLAARDLWRLNGESFFGPTGFRDAALGLSGVSQLVEEHFVKPEEGGPQVGEVRLIPNPDVLPMVRAYDRAVVVGDGGLAPVLATSLAPRNVGVVTGGAAEARRLGAASGAVLGGDPCRTAALAGAGDVAGEVAMACAFDRWVGVYADIASISLRHRPGAVFEAPAGGLRGVSVWLDRSPHPSALTLWELAADGRSLGQEIDTVFASGYDHFGIVSFAFDPIPDSAGKRYAFELFCDTCEGRDGFPRLATANDSRAPANLLRNRNRVGGRVADFSLLYDRVPVAPPSATAVEARRDGHGRWRLRSSGPTDALVVVAEAWFPGWKATVDGRPAPVLKSDGAFLGVAVGPGEHEITLAYEPPATVTVGRAVTAVTLAGAAALLVGGARQHRRRRARRGRASGPAGHDLHVGPPAGGPRREPVLDPRQPEPGPAAGLREGPRRERQQAVLAPVGDGEAGLPQQPGQGGGGEPGADGNAVPLGADAAADADDGVVLDGLGEDEVAAGAEDPPNLGQDPDGVIEVVKHVDAPHQADGGVTEW
ncbi:MAG TPA: YfhO family protein, partial [Acidimicrobiales bacterium]|nr:YfhO family protein [Acidimicrobiales bacterium]